MRAFTLERPVALTIAAMNTLQVLLTVEDQLACLERVRAGPGAQRAVMRASVVG